MDEIKSWVLNIAAVAVLMVILDLVMPEGRIKKFTQLLTGFIIMFVMINPVLELFGKGTSASFAGWKDETFMWNNQVQQIAGNYKEEQTRQTLELYREMLLADIRSRLINHEKIGDVKVDVVLNENTASGKFGEIRKLYINLSLAAFGESMSEKEKENIRSQCIKEIKKELQQVFLLGENDIHIQISNRE